MHTTTQARTLWCPMVRIARREEFTHETGRVPGRRGQGELVATKTDHHIVAGCNTDALGGLRVPKSCRCIADECAMWRWGELSPIRIFKVVGNPANERAKADPTGERVQACIPASWGFVPYDEAEGDPAGWIEPEQEARARRLGFCGLAGSPAHGV